MTACQSMMLVSMGAPVTPLGGSFWSLLKSLNKRRLALVLMIQYCVVAFDIVGWLAHWRWNGWLWRWSGSVLTTYDDDDDDLMNAR
mmetsp:Transcript_6891/g.15154  ORF Transcript_6891/g.15154 Transcript_6891/m.15154 type:complete len:86 (-) Transcript_6891:137-394(-)